MEDIHQQHTFSNHSRLRYEDREALRNVAGHLRSARLTSAAKTAYWWARRESWRFSPARLIDRRYDLGFDRRFNVETTRRVDLTTLDLPEEAMLHGVYYQATSASLARRLIAKLDIDYRDFTFVDLGSGKGRVLMIAAQFPFQRVVGVELSEELCHHAKKNFAAATIPYKAPIELARQSAADYPFDHKRMVVFLFNPFDQAILQPVADRIGRRLAESGTEAWVLYHSPRCREILDRTPGLRVAAEVQHTVIYHGKAA